MSVKIQKDETLTASKMTFKYTAVMILTLLYVFELDVIRTIKFMLISM